MAFRLTGRGDGGFEDLDTSHISQVRGYWEALRNGASLPERAAVDPRGMAGALEHSFLIERVAPGLARFRIAGMVFTDLLGMDVRGMPISALFSGEARIELQKSLEKMFSTPGILSLNVTDDRGLGKSRVWARFELLPLLDAQGACTLALGCVGLSSPAFRLGHLFSIASVHHQLISGMSAPDPMDIPKPAAEPKGCSPLRLNSLPPARPDEPLETLHLP